MHKISDIKCRYIARDKATGHLRYESRALTWEEASEFTKSQVFLENSKDWNWNLEVLDVR